MALLSCQSVSKNFGGLMAVDRVDLSIDDGELLGLIGPNGAGKTTMFNLITGFLAPSGGSIKYRDQDILRRPPHQLAEQGLVRTFQKINVFSELTVEDNVLIGAHLQFKTNYLKALTLPGRNRRERETIRGQAGGHLKEVGLERWRHARAKNLPLGLQRALGIAVALTAKPKLLLLDEPASGMTPDETRQIMEVIRRVHASGITVLMVEHDMQVVMNLCQRLIVLDFGQVVAEGTPEQIRNDPKVVEVYLGKGFKRDDS
ncbi:MAG: ABC transporter ATP-binding protein [Deltaproteobacteria bacterium]|nr:ABC transporter ATP-binding protein [Deltaproteobacteria bacterium]